MTITAPTSTTAHSAAPTDPMRNHARAAGIFYLLTFASSIPALILIGPILDNATTSPAPARTRGCCGAASSTQ